MPALVATSMAAGDARAVNRVTLTATGNPIAYTPGAGQILQLMNTTAGALTPTLVGSAAAPQFVPGFGTIATGAGISLGAIPATTGHILVPLDSVGQYLRGTIDITGGTGLIATLLNPA